MKHRIFCLLCAAIVSVGAAFCASAADTDDPQPDFSVPFAQYDTCTMCLDVYMPKDTLSDRYCVLYAYGGGFVQNNQREKSTRRFCRRLADNGYVAVAVDYRLGLTGVRMHGVLSMVKPLENAVTMAAEDMLRAVAFTLEHADEWGIRPDGIVVSGASAGAITSLQTDYELCNRTAVAEILPEDFRLAGVMSFAGAVYSTRGRCRYRHHAPAPTLLLHGDKDNIVTYNKIAFFGVRFSGSSDLVRTFRREGYPYEIIRYVDEGHGVAGRMLPSWTEVRWFLDNMVVKGRHFEIDKTVYDKDHKRASWDRMSAKNLY